MVGRVRFVFLLVSIVFVFSSWSMLGDNAPRRFRMGLSSNISAPTAASTRFIASYIQTHADVFAELLEGNSLPWCDFLPGGSVSAETAAEFQALRNKRDQLGPDMKYYVLVGMLSTLRRGVADGPCKPADTFADARVRSAFIRYVQYVVDVLNPDYLTIGVEIDLYNLFNPVDFPNAVSLYREAYRAVKATYPDLLIFPEFALDILYEANTWSIIPMFGSDLDAIGLSFYGSANIPSQNLPADYVSKIYQYTDKPLVISEMAFLSRPTQLSTGERFRGSEEEQMTFLTRMLSEAEQQEMLFVVWFLVADTQEWLAHLPASDPQRDVILQFMWCGLHEWPSRRTKPAEAVWTTAFSRPLDQSGKTSYALPYSVPPAGVQSLVSSGGLSDSKIGSLWVSPSSGNAAPMSAAVLSLTRSNTLLTEATIPSSTLTTRWRGFVHTSTKIRTGVAIANPNEQSAQITLQVLGPDGATALGRTTSILPPHGQTVKYIDEFAAGLPENFQGSVGLESDRPVAAVDLKHTTNERAESVITTVPAADGNAPPSNSPLSLPLVIYAVGFATEIVLINPTDGTLTGAVRFYTPQGTDLAVTLGGQTASRFPYSIPPSRILTLKTSGSDALIGHAQVTPDSGQVTPMGSTLFSFVNNGTLITESAVAPFQLASSAKLFVDASEEKDMLVAIANPNRSSTTVRVRALANDGRQLDSASATINLVARGSMLQLLNELVPALPRNFRGSLYIESSQPVSLIGLRRTYNQRGDFLLSAQPVTGLTAPSDRLLIVPQIADGSGYHTQIILINPTPATLTGSVTFVTPSGDNQRLRLSQ